MKVELRTLVKPIKYFGDKFLNMSKFRYNLVFLILFLIVLISYYLSYLYKNDIFIYSSIIFSLMLIIINIFFMSLQFNKDTLKILNYEVYNLDKFIIGLFCAIYLFLFDVGLPKTELHIMSYIVVSLSLLSSLRILK